MHICSLSFEEKTENLIMPRPTKERIVHHPPLFDNFKPIGIQANFLEEIHISLDEYEAIRLADHLGQDHSEAADAMGISRPTFSRLVEKARNKIADFLINGKILKIDGGSIHFKGNLFKCSKCGTIFESDIESLVSKCEKCGSEDLINLAGGFGHGKCCGKHRRRRL